MTPAAFMTALSALAQSTRFKTVEVLSAHQPAGLIAGALVAAVGTPKNTLSTHLAILTNAELVTSTRAGRNIIYRVNADTVASVAAKLSSLVVNTASEALRVKDTD